MSGGHYDYKFGRMNDLAEEIRMDCVKNATPYKDEFNYEHAALPPDILTHMKFVADQISVLAEAARDIEWYMSRDYGDDTLRERCESWKLSAQVRVSRTCEVEVGNDGRGI